MIKFTDFELEFLKQMDLELEHNHFVNHKNGKIFEYVKQDICSDHVTHRYTFACNSIRIEFYRKNGKPTKQSVYVKSHNKTCFAGEYICCDMIDTCDCDLSDEYKSRIIGVTDRDYKNSKTYETYICLEYKIGDEHLKTRVERYVNGVSYTSPYEIISTGYEIFDNIAHNTNENVIANANNYDFMLSKAIKSKYRNESKIRSFYEKYKSFFVDAYTRSLACIKDNENEHKK